MRSLAAGVIAVVIAVAGCGGDDDGGELTPEHIVAAVGEVDPQCNKPRIRPNGPNAGEVVCGDRSAALYMRHGSVDAAEAFAASSDQTTYTSGRFVILTVPGDPERFVDELRARCDCEIKRR
jgi:hypothetical protein